MFFFFEWTGEHRDLHVLTHSFPTRRSSDLNITQRFAQQLAFEGELHVEWRPLSALPTGEALMRLRDANLTVLNLVSAVEEHRADGSDDDTAGVGERSEEHTSELQSLMRISYAVFCLKKKKIQPNHLY